MVRLLALFIFLSLLVQASQWSYSKEFSLHKDEFLTMTIKEQNTLRVLKFRWTLFAGDGLVMHLSYNQGTSQFVLFKHYKKDTYKVQLLPKKSAYKRVPYLYLVFKKYDYKTSKAHFDIFIDDPESRALVEVKPQRK